MAGKVFTLWGSVRADDTALKKDLASAHRQVETAGNKMRTSLDSAAKQMGKVLTVALVAATAVVVYELQKVGREAIKAASDLEETTSKFNTVFKGQEKIAQEWSKTLVDSYAMSTRESKQFLASIQDLLVPMGMNATEAGKMSFEVVKLAADLGSFNNLPTAQVMMDIQSALVGNFETMKKYGVVLNETVVKEKALAMGLIKTGETLNANQKAQVAYALMVKGSAAAIGDMARTSEGYANQLKSLNATYEDFLAVIGEKLLPVATKVVSVMRDWLKVNQDFIAQKVADAVSAWPDILITVLETIQQVVAAIGFMSKAWDSLIVAANIAINGLVTGLAIVFDKASVLLTPFELIFDGLMKIGAVDYNPITAGITKINETLIMLAQSTDDVLGDSIIKLEENIQKYGDYDIAIQRTIDEVKRLGTEYKSMTEFDVTALDDLGRSWEVVTEKIEKAGDVVKKVIGYLNGIPVEAYVRIKAIDEATPTTTKIKSDLEAITKTKIAKTATSGSVKPATGSETTTISGTSGGGDAHIAKVDVQDNATSKIGPIKGALDEIKVGATGSVDIQDKATEKIAPIKSDLKTIGKGATSAVTVTTTGLGELKSAYDYHMKLKDLHTKSTHTVTTIYKSIGTPAGTTSLDEGISSASEGITGLTDLVNNASPTYAMEFIGSGSTTKSLGEKIKEIQGWLQNTKDKASEGATLVVDFKGKGSTETGLSDKIFDSIIKINDLYQTVIDGPGGDQTGFLENFTTSIETKTIPTIYQLISSVRDLTGMLSAMGLAAQENIWRWLQAKHEYLEFMRAAYPGIPRERIPPWSKPRGGFGAQSGGYIPGYGGGDTVSLMAERGEYVSDKDTVKRFGVGFFDNLKIIKGAQVSSGGGGTTIKTETSEKSGATYNITVAPQFMTGDKAAARQVAITIKRELDELNYRWA